MDESDQALLSRVLYLASLVSDLDTIDSDLDTLRIITAHHQPGQPFPVEDINSLRTLSSRLEDYLIYKDPVRSFTKASLEQKIKQHFEGNKFFFKRPIWSLFLIIASSAVLASLAFVIPSTIEQNTKTQLAMSLFFFGIHCGNIWFFMSSLRNFRKELRLAFSFLATGVLLVGIVGAQFTLINLFGLSDSNWTKYGGFLFLFPISYLPLLVGIYLFAKQLKIASWVMSLRIPLMLCVVIALLLAIMPNKAAPAEEAYYLISAIGIAVATVILGWTTAIAYTTTKHLTPQYARAMKLLAAAFAIISVTGIALLGALMGMGHLTLAAMNIALSPVLIAEPLELLGGYTFRKRSSE